MNHQYYNGINRFENIRTTTESSFRYMNHSNKNPIPNHRKRPREEEQYPSTKNGSGYTRHYNHSSRRFDNPNRDGTTRNQLYPQQNLYCKPSNRMEHEQVQQAPSDRDNVDASSSCSVAAGVAVTNLQTNYNGNGKANHNPKRNNYSAQEIAPKIEVSGTPYQNRLLAQLSRTNLHSTKVPKEIMTLLPHEIDRVIPEDTVSAAVQEVMKVIQEKKGNPGFRFSKDEIKEFFTCLPQNLVFDMGFRVQGLKEEHLKTCWCPWGNKMLPWREQCTLDGFMERRKSCCNQNFLPVGFRDHLDQMKNSCALHLVAHKYLWILYGNLRNFGHKALFNQNGSHYQRAEALERTETVELHSKELQEAKRKILELKQENEQKESKILEYQERLRLTDQEEYRNIAELVSCFKAFGLKHELQDFIGEGDNYSVEDEVTFDTLFESTVKCLRLGIPEPKDKKRVIIEVDQEFGKHKFNINAMLIKQYDAAQSIKSPTTIFEEKVAKHKLLYDWKVEIKALNYKDHKNSKTKQENSPVDKGGPTRQLFSEFWGNLDKIVVTFNGASLHLFTSKRSGFCPMMDKNLEEFIDECMKLYSFENATKEEQKVKLQHAEKLNRQIDLYYRAVGIFFFRAIVGRYSIPPKAMPRFLRNVLLRNCEPKDTLKYSNKQVLLDSKEMFGIEIEREDVIGKTLSELTTDYAFDVRNEEEGSQKITDENFVSLFMQTINVERHSRAITNMKRGITLDGDADFTPLFSRIPTDLLSKKIFGKGVVSADALIAAILGPDGDKYVTDNGEEKKVAMQRYHYDFFNGPMKETIREWNDEERSLFVFFCTGYKHLPNEDFRIWILFSPRNDIYPYAHTCEQQLVLPEYAYNADKNLFQEKLIYSMKNQGSYMTMN